MTVTEKILRKALELGFLKAGIVAADDFNEYYDEVMSRKEYEYFYRRKEMKNCHLREHYPTAQAILSLAYAMERQTIRRSLDAISGGRIWHAATSRWRDLFTPHVFV